MSLVINKIESIPKTVSITWPKPDTRIPQAQRPTPIIDGKLECEFAYHSQQDLEEIDAKVEDGEISAMDRFRKIVPAIKGLPIADGEPTDPHEWLDQAKYGAVITNAIMTDYWAFLAEDRRGNSKKRRSR